jgi:hypothetical protein
MHKVGAIEIEEEEECTTLCVRLVNNDILSAQVIRCRMKQEDKYELRGNNDFSGVSSPVYRHHLRI